MKTLKNTQLNTDYSTTKRLYKVEFEQIESEIKSAQRSEEIIKTQIFLPACEKRQGEGGLRKKGFFKKSQHKKPLITIVTVVYNDETNLERTIQSVINQSYDNVEYLLIDGGSVDGTLDIIHKYDDVIDYWVSEKDQGMYDAMNKGIDLATGDWIIFLNSGDRFYDQEVLRSIFAANLDSYDIVFGKSKTIYGEYSCIRYNNFHVKNKQFYLRRMPNHQAVFIAKNIYKKNKYNLNLSYLSDTEYLRRVFKEGRHYEYKGMISCFSLGGVSNYYPNFSVFKQLIREHQILGRSLFKSLIIHGIKYILQRIMGKDLYLKFYIRFLLKE